MDKDKELEKLRYEIKVLRDTVSTLTKTIDDLKSTVSGEDSSCASRIFPERNKIIKKICFRTFIYFMSLSFREISSIRFIGSAAFKIVSSSRIISGFSSRMHL